MRILILLLLSLTIFCEGKRNKYECWQKGLKPENLNIKKRNKCTVTKLTNFTKPTENLINSVKPSCNMKVYSVKTDLNTTSLRLKAEIKLIPFEESVTFKGFQLKIQHDRIVHWITYSIGLPKAFKNSIQSLFTIHLNPIKDGIKPNNFLIMKVKPLSGRSDTSCEAKLYINDCCKNPTISYPKCRTMSCYEPETPWVTANPESTSKKNSGMAVRTQITISLLVLLSLLVGILILVRFIKNPSKDILVLVSKGDTDTYFCNEAQEIAHKLLTSNLYENVFCNLWLSSCDDQNFEKLYKIIEQCAIAVVICSPYGKQSYEELLHKKNLTTWRDEFNVGCYSLLKNFHFPDKKKIYVVYSCDDCDKPNHVHSDFDNGCAKSFNIFKKNEKRSLYERLLPEAKLPYTRKAY